MGYCTPDQYETLVRSVRGVQVPLRIPRVQTEPPTGEQIRIILRSLEMVPVPHLRLLSAPGHVQVSRRGCATRRFGIMLNTPAFEGWTGPLSELRRSPEAATPSTTPGGPGMQPMPP